MYTIEHEKERSSTEKGRLVTPRGGKLEV